MGAVTTKPITLRTCFSAPLSTRHVTSVVEMSCPSLYETHWSFGIHNVDAVLALHKVTSLKMTVNYEDIVNMQASMTWYANPVFLPNFDKEIADAIKYEGLPPLEPETAKADIVVFRNVGCIFLKNDATRSVSEQVFCRSLYIHQPRVLLLRIATLLPALRRLLIFPGSVRSDNGWCGTGRPVELDENNTGAAVGDMLWKYLREIQAETTILLE
ncbi:hypothetical protein C8R44DRAFT_928971 [Mycena epipterygia]|nr:hypothetical protein C8R44DRAFT_928971 [Mycena epipterygia]